MSRLALLIPVWSAAGLVGVAAVAVAAVSTGSSSAGAASEPTISAPAPVQPGGPPVPPSQPQGDAEEAAEDEQDEEPEWDVPSRITAPPIATAKPLPKEQDLVGRAKRKGDSLFVRHGGAERELTLNAELQERLTEILRSYETPYAAVVVIDPTTGRVLAMAEHSQADPAMRGLPTKAIFPAASVFKVVTAAALLKEGVTPETTECSFGGKRRLSVKMLEDTERDSKCLSLSRALAVSANSVFAKLTHKHLTPDKLKATAKAFGFNTELEFPIPTDVSLAAFPEEKFAFASTGAGFGDVYLSPLHGAVIAAVAANKGRWVAPRLWEHASAPFPPPVEPLIPTFLEPVAVEPVLTESQAELLTSMMEETITVGTARRMFRQRGFRVPGAVGKTGNLADKRPVFRDYSWFVGFASKDEPKIAVAAVIVNDMKWRIRATWLGREAMRLGIEAEQKKTARREAEQGTPVTGAR